MTESSATYAETLVAFRNLLSDGIDHPPYSEYVRGGVNLIADLFGIVERDTSERMEDVKADLRRIPMYADPNDLGRYGVAEYVHDPAAPTPRQWTITVDYVPGQNWEAAIESDGDYSPGGFEAQNLRNLLASVAAELQAEVQASREET
jgi:hypothetical protein